MDINQLNDLSTDNLKTKDLSTDNTAQSDETKTNFDYVTKGPTDYAKNKRVSKVSSTVGIVATFSVSAILGGTLLGNTFVGTLPSVSNQKFQIEGNQLNYSFTITNKGSRSALLTITTQEKEVYTTDVSKTGDYSSSLTLNYQTSYQAKIVATNQVDYYKTIYETSFTIPAKVIAEAVIEK
ncbi:MAG: hypothetical protein WCR67_03125 [Bacilli bacterium]